MKDWDLLQRYVEDRSQTAFEGLAKRYAGLVYGTCLRELGSADLAEDASHAVFILLAQKARTFRRHQMLSSWLFKTSILASRNLRRSEHRRTRYEQASIAGRDDLRCRDVEQEVVLQDGLATLPTPDRDAVIGRFIDGLSFAEMASTLGIREDAARMRVNRGLERLRRHFERHGIALTIAALAAVMSEVARPVDAAPSTIGTTSNIGPATPAGSHLMKVSNKALLFGSWAGTLGILAIAVNYVSGRQAFDPTASHLAHPSIDDGKWKQLTARAVAQPLGKPNAPYSVVELGDFACPQCGLMHADIEKLPDTAPVNLYFVNRPFPNLKDHEYALPAAEAGYAAAAQGKFWSMFDALYSHQANLEPALYAGYANQAGLDGAALSNDVASGKYLTQVTDSYTYCDSIGLQATPTIIVRDNRSEKYQVAEGRAEIDKLIQSEPWGKMAAVSTSVRG